MPGLDIERVVQIAHDIELQAAARSAGDIPFWTPQLGSHNRIRLMPPWSDELRSFDREVFMHFAVGEEEQMFTCPMKTPRIKNFDCPVCHHVDALRATGNPDDAEMASRIYARKRYMTNIVDLNNPVYTQQDVNEWKATKPVDCPFKVGQTKVQMYTYGPQVFNQLVNFIAQLKQDLTDYQTGYDILITKTGKDLTVKYQLMLDPVRKPFAHLSDISIPNLDALVRIPKVEAMRAAVAGSAKVPASYGMQAAVPPPSMPVSQAPALAAPIVSMPPPAPIPAPVQTLAPPPAVAAKADDVPACFKDSVTFSVDDPECAGGMVDGAPMPKCPVYQECGTHAGKLVAESSARRRRGKAAAPKNGDAPALSEADILEMQMQEALKRS